MTESLLEALEKRVKPLAESIKSPKIYECDVSDEKSIKSTFDNINKEYGKIDFVKLRKLHL